MSEQPELYLILHKVRGEPAFDIAHKVQIGDEEGWIIPTSGHRAYPSWYYPMDRLDCADYSDYYEHNPPMSVCGRIPDVWPDHYSANASPKTSIRDIIRGLFPKQPSNFKKRAW